MKAVEIREMSTEDILKELEGSREELMRIRFQITTGELSDTSRTNILKKKIARMITILKEREIVESLEGDA
jgi:large subunit ribosomal protein L29